MTPVVTASMIQNKAVGTPLLMLFFAVVGFATVLPTPGGSGWLDLYFFYSVFGVTHYWFQVLFVAVFSFGLCFAVLPLLFQPGPVPKLKAAFLWLLFGGTFKCCLDLLFAAQMQLVSESLPGPFDFMRHPILFFMHGR